MATITSVFAVFLLCILLVVAHQSGGVCMFFFFWIVHFVGIIKSGKKSFANRHSAVPASLSLDSEEEDHHHHHR